MHQHHSMQQELCRLCGVKGGLMVNSNRRWETTRSEIQTTSKKSQKEMGGAREGVWNVLNRNWAVLRPVDVAERRLSTTVAAPSKAITKGGRAN